MLSTEITDKYLVHSNTFIGKNPDVVTEEREIEIGDIHSDDFQPQVKLMQWENETNFSIRLIDTDSDIPTIETDKNKIKFIKKDRECHFYDVENGFEFEVLLKSKPKTNTVQMSIESKGLKFNYQPELTEKEIDEGHTRLENVVGSYAVYHESKQGDYSGLGLKNYRAGKAFHIYRPKIIDSVGTEVWGALHINIVDKFLTVDIPQEFLDNAVYPVIVDPTFGYETIATGGTSGPYNHISGSEFTLSEAGDATSITVYLNGTTGGLLKCALYKADLSFIVATEERTLPASAAWYQFDFAAPQSLVAGDYILVAWGPATGFASLLVRDIDTGVKRWWQEVTYGVWPSTLNASDRTGVFSIYCTYTVGGDSITNNLDGKLIIIDSSIILVDGLLRLKDTNIDLFDGNVSILHAATNTVDGNVQVQDSVLNLLDGHTKVKNNVTNLLDGNVILSDISTVLVDGKLRIKDITTSLLDSKLIIKSISIILADGKVQIKDIKIELIDGLVKIKDDIINNVDGKVRIKDIITSLTDGKIKIFKKISNLLDGKINVIGQIVTNLLDGKLIIKRISKSHKIDIKIGLPTKVFEQGETIPIITYTYDLDNVLMDQDNLTVTINKLDGTEVVNALMTHTSAGTYLYKYTLNSDADLGIWTIKVESVNGTINKVKNDFFKVVST